MLTSCSRPSERRLVWLVAESVAPLEVLVAAGPAVATLWSFLEHTPAQVSSPVDFFVEAHP